MEQAESNLELKDITLGKLCAKASAVCVKAPWVIPVLRQCLAVTVVPRTVCR